MENVMNLSQIRFRAFFNAIVTVNKQLQSREGTTQLLDAAREDTPIIDEMLRETKLIETQCNDPGELDDMRRTMQRDLTVILALRHLLQSEDKRARAAVFPRIAAN
jgi:hypothetical protein